MRTVSLKLEKVVLAVGHEQDYRRMPPRRTLRPIRDPQRRIPLDPRRKTRRAW